MQSSAIRTHIYSRLLAYIQGAVLAHKFWGDCFQQQYIYEVRIFSVFFVFFCFFIGLRLKSIISRVANSVICNPETVETRPEEPRAGWGS